MITYRAHCAGENALALFRSVQRRLCDAEVVSNHDAIQSLLIDFSEVEAAVADVNCPSIDAPNEVNRAYREVSVALGRMLLHSWHQNGAGTELALRSARNSFAQIERTPPTPHLITSVPEGFAFYSLYPEMYLVAAEQLSAELQPNKVTCLGIRSIGTTLSAVVTAGFEKTSADVLSITVRPHGHSFDRRLSLTAETKQQLASRADGIFCVIDEGPGLSGSSFAGVAEALKELGIADDRIILFPSWLAHESQLCSERARKCWTQHRKVIAEFEDVFLNSQRLFGSDPVFDWSAGKWREKIFSREADFPPAVPQHERRKYFLPRSNKVAKFSGLGRYGEAKMKRFRRLQEIGIFGAVDLSPSLSHGFLFTNQISGKRLTREANSEDLIERIAIYAAALHREFPAKQATAEEELWHMMETNISEGLGAEWKNVLSSLEHLRPLIVEASPVEIDARMLPHEWCKTENEFVKFDALDHHNDHFLPGSFDVAWDLAAATEEFEFPESAALLLIDNYKKLSGDSQISSRLRYNRVAYLAFKLGYVTQSMSIVGIDERLRIDALRCLYSRKLKLALQAAAVLPLTL